MAKTNGTFDLMQAMQGMEARLAEKIGEVGANVSTALAKVDAEEKARIADVRTLRNEILGREGRVPKIEQEMRDAKRWENLKHAMGPALVIIHGIAHKFGVTW